MTEDVEFGKASTSNPDPRPSFTTNPHCKTPVIFAPGESSQVGWDDERDAANPMNWSGAKKALNVGIVSILAFMS
jgi:hypothetical protein